MSTSILKVLTELTALSSSGITVLKPFRPWYGIESWRGRTVSLRLLNVKEIESALEAVSTVSATAQEQALKKEVMARALWAIDGQTVANKEDLDAYNQAHKTLLSEVEYKRVFIQDFEQYFLDYLYTLYTELQNKQVRKVMGLHQCAVCKKQTTALGDKDRKIRFNTAEYVCAACDQTVVDEDGFDFETPRVDDTPKKEDAGAAPEVATPRILTQADFTSLEDYKTYLIELGDSGDTTEPEVHP
jgi:hypothetical protein